MIIFIFGRASKRLTHWILMRTAKISLIKLKIQAVNYLKVTEVYNFHPCSSPLQFITHFINLHLSFIELVSSSFFYTCSLCYLTIRLPLTIFHMLVVILLHQLQMNLFLHSLPSIYTNCQTFTSLS